MRRMRSATENEGDIRHLKGSGRKEDGRKDGRNGTMGVEGIGKGDKGQGTRDEG